MIFRYYCSDSFFMIHFGKEAPGFLERKTFWTVWYWVQDEVVGQRLMTIIFLNIWTNQSLSHKSSLHRKHHMIRMCREHQCTELQKHLRSLAVNVLLQKFPM